ncbi:MAG TPA: carboxypeptidase regulatory-like domain-containing protein, partial [Planctomycetota bacterium]|nr:carboxypeptidase regulatory-like domain-containing protein [Planctomycetota bacterium]
MATRLLALAAAAALLLPAAAPGQDAPGESSSPWDGLLPDPDQGRGGGKRLDSEWLACRVLDGTTGLPVAGARLRRYPEWSRPATLRHSYLLGEGTTDADGFARVPALLYFHDGDSHWIVDAPGYAPAHEFGAYPERTVLLRRGEDLRGRVLDALGRPAGGATVELFLGCGHSPAVRTTVTAPDGRFTLPCVPPGEGTLWILTPAGAANYVNLGPSYAFGERPTDFVLAPGATATGRVIDAAGDPIPGAVVRSWQEQRGPAAVTGLDGSFTLEGLEPGHDFQVFHPSPVGEDAGHVGNGWLEEVPVVVRMTAAGPVDPPASDGTLVVRARHADGKPAVGVEFAAARLEDGSPDGGTTSDGDSEDEPPAGEARVDVAAGTWFIRPESRFGEGNFEPVDAAVPKDGVGEATVVLLPPARLRIRGDIPEEGVSFRLAIPGEKISPDDESRSPWE